MEEPIDNIPMPHVFAAMVILACTPAECHLEALAILETLLGTERYDEAFVALSTDYLSNLQMDAWREATRCE